jgi:hypothetical protein
MDLVKRSFEDMIRKQAEDQAAAEASADNPVRH